MCAVLSISHRCEEITPKRGSASTNPALAGVMKLHRMHGCSSVAREPFAAVPCRRRTVEKACAFCHRPVRTLACDLVQTVRPLPLVSVPRRRRDDGRHSGWTAFRHFQLASLSRTAAVLGVHLRSIRMWMCGCGCGRAEIPFHESDCPAGNLHPLSFWCRSDRWRCAWSRWAGGAAQCSCRCSAVSEKALD